MRAAIETMIASPEALKTGLIEGAKIYIETPKDQYKPGISHGEVGLNRAENLQSLRNIKENDLEKLFAILYAVMCPHGLSNFFESRSTYLAQCVAISLIQGSYEHYTGSFSTDLNPNKNNLKSTALQTALINASKNALDSLDSCHSQLGSSTVYAKEKALRWMLEKTREKMSKEEKKVFDSHVSIFKKALVQKPSQDIAMSSLTNDSDDEEVYRKKVSELHAV